MNKKKIACLPSQGAGKMLASVQAAPLKMALVAKMRVAVASAKNMFCAAVKCTLDCVDSAGGWCGEPIGRLKCDNQSGPVLASDTLKAAIANCSLAIVRGSRTFNDAAFPAYWQCKNLLSN